MRLTIGMAVYNDPQGVYFTVESLMMYHDLTDCEVLVIDNYGDKQLQDWIEYWGKEKVRYERFTEKVGTTPPRQRVFESARGESVICIDSHVLLVPGALDKPFPLDDNLWHGPMLYDDLKSCCLKMRPEWRSQMWGVWDDSVSVENIPADPFEIEMHGLGLFGCRKDAWPGFNEHFRGFGGEEGYIHEKFRQAGKTVLCLPWLRWVHRFGRNGDYPLNGADRVKNYLLGFSELGLDPKPIYEHFGINVVRASRNGLSSLQ